MLRLHISVTHHLAMLVSLMMGVPAMCSAIRRSTKTRPSSTSVAISGELELGVLELGDRLAEGLALCVYLTVSSSTTSMPAWAPIAQTRPLLLELLHQIVEAAALPAPSRLSAGTRQSAKCSSDVSWRVHAHLVELAALLEARRAVLDHEQAHPAVARLGVGLGGDDHEVAEDAVRDERLLRR